MSDTTNKLPEEMLTVKATDATTKQAKPELDEAEALWSRSLQFFEMMNATTQHAKI